MIEKYKLSKRKMDFLIVLTSLLFGILLLTRSGNQNLIPGLFAYISCLLLVIVIKTSSRRTDPENASILKEHSFEWFTDPIIILDHRNRIVDLNQAAQKLVCSTKNKVLGTSVEEILVSVPISQFGTVIDQQRSFEVLFNGITYDCHILQAGNLAGYGPMRLLLLDEVKKPQENSQNPTPFASESGLITRDNSQFVQSIAQFSKFQTSDEIFKSLAEKILSILDATSVFVFSVETQASSEARLLAEAYSDHATIQERMASNNFFHSVMLGNEDEAMNGQKVRILKRDDPALSEQHRKLFSLTGYKSAVILLLRNTDLEEIGTEIHDSRFDKDYDQDELATCQSLILLAGNSSRHLELANKLSNAIEERTRIQERSTYDTYHDPVTGLPNRSLFNDRLSQALSSYRQGDTKIYAVLLLDLDKFKIINDSLGHRTGDQLLNAVGQRLRESVREKDMVARIGGDEFAILLADINDVDEAILTSERIQSALERGFVIGANEVFTSASIGITIGRNNYDHPSDVLRDADASMYRAKGFGGGNYAIYNEDMLSQARHLLTTLNDLRRAIRKSEFEVYYQPIISFSSHRPVSFEALIRWNHPEKGLVSPSEFIPIAEEHGLISEIGELVLRTACRQLKTWQVRFPQEPPLAVSVNISAKQLEDCRFVDVVKAVLDENQPAPGSLILEITESSIIRETDSALEILTKLKSLGVKLYLDDFGMGHSSLNTLHKFPIDNIKLDRLFVARMTEDKKDIEIVRTIVELGIQLDKVVVAEGIESPSQQKLLEQLNCNFGQGYYFSMPVVSSKINQMLIGATSFGTA